MPFQSKAQARMCYARKRQGKNRSWDCDEWAEKTDFDELPEKVSAALLQTARQGAILKVAQFLDHLIRRSSAGPLFKQAAAERSLRIVQAMHKGASLDRALAVVCPSSSPSWRHALGKALVRGAMRLW